MDGDGAGDKQESKSGKPQTEKEKEQSDIENIKEGIEKIASYVDKAKRIDNLATSLVKAMTAINDNQKSTKIDEILTILKNSKKKRKVSLRTGDSNQGNSDGNQTAYEAFQSATEGSDAADDEGSNNNAQNNNEIGPSTIGSE